MEVISGRQEQDGSGLSAHAQNTTEMRSFTGKEEIFMKQIIKFIDVDEKFKKTEIRYDFRTRKIIMG